MDVNQEIATNLAGQTVIVTGGTRGIGLGGNPLHLNKLESPSPKDDFCQVW